VSHWKKSDDVLLKELAVLTDRFDRVPSEVLTMARSSFASGSGWDIALAQLVYDSATDENDSRALVRATTGVRDLSFEGPSLAVEVVVEPCISPKGGSISRIIGQLVPGCPATIEVRRPASTATITADDLGRFVVDEAASGPISLRCTPRGESTTDTEWILI
jgi:hypothetical protein